jgi:hypothetical protein
VATGASAAVGTGGAVIIGLAPAAAANWAGTPANGLTVIDGKAPSVMAGVVAEIQIGWVSITGVAPFVEAFTPVQNHRPPLSAYRGLAGRAPLSAYRNLAGRKPIERRRLNG